MRTIIDMNEAHDFDVIITRGKDLAILKAAQSARGDFPYLRYFRSFTNHQGKRKNLNETKMEN